MRRPLDEGGVDPCKMFLGQLNSGITRQQLARFLEVNNCPAPANIFISRSAVHLSCAFVSFAEPDEASFTLKVNGYKGAAVSPTWVKAAAFFL